RRSGARSPGAPRPGGWVQPGAYCVTGPAAGRHDCHGVPRERGPADWPGRRADFRRGGGRMNLPEQIVSNVRHTPIERLLVLSVTLVPVAAALLLRPSRPGSPEDVWIIRALKSIYAPALDRALRHAGLARIATLAITI